MVKPIRLHVVKLLVASLRVARHSDEAFSAALGVLEKQKLPLAELQAVLAAYAPMQRRPTKRAGVIAQLREGFKVRKDIARARDVSSEGAPGDRSHKPVDISPPIIEHVRVDDNVTALFDETLARIIPGHAPSTKRRRGRPSKTRSPSDDNVSGLGSVDLLGRIPEDLLIELDLTLARVENRLRRAILTLEILPDRDKRFQRDMKAAWPVFLPEKGDGPDVNSLDIRDAFAKRFDRFEPTPVDVGDCLQALSWLNGPTASRDHKLLRLRAAGFSYEQMSSVLGQPRSSLHCEVVEIHKRAWNAALQQALAVGEREFGLHSPDRSGATVAHLQHRLERDGLLGTARAHHALAATGRGTPAHAKLLAVRDRLASSPLVQRRSDSATPSGPSGDRAT
jgi:hypothetical protein